MKKSLNIVGYIAGLLMFTTVVMKINHFPGAGAAMILAGVGLSIYLPFFLLYKPGEESNAGTNRVGIAGAISASIINLAITFKFQHWPGAGVLMTLGLVCFALVFVPMLLRKRVKDESSERKTLMNTMGAVGLMLFSLGILFKIMHWPGAAIMLTLSVPFLFLGYFLVYLTDKSINAQEKTIYLRKAFLSVIIGCIVTSLMMVALNKPYLPPTPQELTAIEAQH
jgi:peptidoglycan/LPS O-acetylase OafA/YrhL